MKPVEAALGNGSVGGSARRVKKERRRPCSAQVS
jgi:hypothetical protein